MAMVLRAFLWYVELKDSVRLAVPVTMRVAIGGWQNNVVPRSLASIFITAISISTCQIQRARLVFT
jgi:hypothetical protein